MKKNMLNKLSKWKIARVYHFTESLKLKRNDKCRWMLPLFAGGRLLKVFIMNEKIFTVELLHTRQNRRQLLKNDQQNTSARWDRCSSSSRTWKLTPLASAASSSGKTETMSDSVLWPRLFYASTELGTGGFRQNNNRHLFSGFWGKALWPPNSVPGKRCSVAEALKGVVKRAWDKITIDHRIICWRYTLQRT